MKIKFPVDYEPSRDPNTYGLWSVELEQCSEGCHALIVPGEGMDHAVWHEMLRGRLGEE